MRDRDFIWRLHEDWSPKSIRIAKAGGQTNRNYIIEHKGKKFFVRLPWERQDVVDRVIEGKNIAALSGNKKASRVIPKHYLYVLHRKNIVSVADKKTYVVPDGTLMAEFVEGKELNGELLKRKNVQKALVKTLCAFHESGVRFANRYDVLRDELAKYRGIGMRHPIAQLIPRAELNQLQETEKTLKDKFAASRRGIATHNDLIFENMLLAKTGKVYLVDFEYGGQNVRGGVHYDLGVFAANVFYKKPLLQETFEEIFALAQKTYKQKLDKEKVLYASLANILVMFWWGGVRYFAAETQKEKQYFAKYVKARAEKAQELAESFSK